MRHFSFSRPAPHAPRGILAGILLCALSFQAGCAMIPVAVAPQNPTPNVALLAQSQSLDVAFGPDVEDARDIDTERGTFEIQSWRTSLENGFRNGLQPAFAAKQGTAADLTLRIDEARAVITTGPFREFRIQYAATLLGRDGTVLRRASGIASRHGVLPEFQDVAATPVSEDIGSLTGDMPSTPPPRLKFVALDADVAASIDAMYEDLAHAFFACATGQARCPVATHG